MIRRSGVRRGSLAAGLVAAALLAAGCSSSSSSSSSAAAGASSASSSSGSTATGSPVVVYTSTLIKTPLGDIPQLPAALKAGVLAINKAGGLDGHQVIVKVCNDTDPNAELLCARNAAADKAIAFVSPVFLYNAAAVDSELAQFHIPDVAAINTQESEYSSPMYFAVDAPELAYEACPALVPQKTGMKKIGVLAFNLPVNLGIVAHLEQVMKNIGSDYVGKVIVPANTTDFSSAVQQLSGDGAQTVIMSLSPSQMPGFLEAAASLGKKFAVCTAANQVPVGLLAQLGPAANNVYLASGIPAVSDMGQYKLLADYKQELAAEAATGDSAADPNQGIPIITLRAWLGTKVLQQVAASVHGPLTNETLLAALNKATAVNLGGVVPTLDFAKPNLAAGYARVFNPYATILKWDVSSKQEVATGAKPVDTVRLLTGA